MSNKIDPPRMRPWNLGLRFVLELAAFFAIGLVVSSSLVGGLQWLGTAVAVIGALALWGTFNVLDDPSRSGRAPVEVAGWVRLSLELLILGGAAAALLVSGRHQFGGWLAGLTALHYVVSWPRVRWLVGS